MNTKWQRLKFQPCLPLGKDGRRATGSPEHIAISRRAATEGMVLLKNENNLLPLKPNDHIALFGKASADYVRGGGGSGDVIVAYTHNLIEALETCEKNLEIHMFNETNQFYSKDVRHQFENDVKPGYTKEPELPDDLLFRARAYSDIAIISICRFSSEGWDRKGVVGDGDFYLSPEEQAMVDKVTNAYEHVVVVLNVGGMVDTSWFKDNPKIEAVLLAWQAGMEGADAEADILLGKVTPSGKLTDTFAKSFDDYPSSYNFHEDDAYAEYTDDIFVGYRYFETIPGAKEKVNYPFGYGLSYTDFDIQLLGCEKVDNEIVVSCDVLNVGEYCGKEVLQVYMSSPKGKLDKAACELATFKKTDLLAPNQNRVYTLSFDISSLAAFDEDGVIQKSARILEGGTYTIYLGTSVEDKEAVLEFTLEKDIIVEQLHAYCSPKKLTKKLQSDGTYKACETGEYAPLFDTTDWPEKPRWNKEHISPNYYDTPIPEGRIKLIDVVEKKHTMDEFLDQMNEYDFIDLVSGTPNVGSSNTWGFGDLYPYGVPNITTCDGPAGVRYFPETCLTATAFPCATLLACSWNEELVEEVGACGGLEVKESNIGVWLTPALNIHRSPLCGRNFEYYSEDPLIAGKTAAALVRGIQSNNVGACAKHFCCNNKETNRVEGESRVSERALREIYLKGFEICVKEADPWCIMTSYNGMNGMHTSENKELLTGILRGEWGFQGMVTTDWCNHAEHYREVLAGNDIRMPSGSKKRLLKALELGLITKEDLRPCAKRVLELIMKID